ncbi:IclR family transcriptional regulator domain-containing protein, partial [Variovorax guangxiensis]
PEAELPAVLTRIAPHLKPYGGLTRSILLKLVAQARERGYAAITDYAVAGVTSVGVPIRDRTGQVLGAISVSAIASRMADREAMVVRTLQREVAGLQAALQSAAPHRPLPA